jgi:hypothetical protein
MSGTNVDIFDNFVKQTHAAMRLHGDQDWIFQQARARIKFWPDAWIQSYKWEIRSRNEIDFRLKKFKETRDVQIPKHCSVCVFHGDPNPHDINDPYVLRNWQ